MILSDEAKHLLSDAVARKETDLLWTMSKHLRALDWQPLRDYLCGCGPTSLCEFHATQRAAEHYGAGAGR